MQMICAPQVVTPAQVYTPGWVTTQQGRIVAVGAGAPPAHSAVETRLPTGVLAPGMVDIQINGAFGVDFAGAADEDWIAVLQRLPTTGVTAVVPTYVTATVHQLTVALCRYRALHESLTELPSAARTLGVHLEGPFLSARQRGAHREDLLRDPDPATLDRLLSAAGDFLTYVTLAPERRLAIEAVRRFVAAGVHVAIGHTDADEQTVLAAADAGATLVTHLYNAQRPMRHRDPGVVGAALTDPRLTLGLIVDLHHVMPTPVRLAFAAASGRVALVTDAVAAMGMEPGNYRLGGDTVIVEPGRPPVRRDGAIAGSSVRMDEAVANTVACGVDLRTAIDAATRIPAAAVGRPELGRIEAGVGADLVWLGEDLRARATWIDGRLAWSDGQHPTKSPQPTCTETSQ
jgi:N-acetylglucosamine-6-phosphate deacetylase